MPKRLSSTRVYFHSPSIAAVNHLVFHMRVIECSLEQEPDSWETLGSVSDVR